MARLSRRERARRQAISEGLKRYWRQVRTVAKTRKVPLTRARTITATVRQLAREQKVSFTKALELPQPRIEPDDTQEEFAFNLQDRDTQEGWELDRKIRGREQTWAVSWHLWDKDNPGNELDSGHGTITFETAGGYEKFWSNYFAACRDFLKTIPGGYDSQELAVHVPLRFINA